MLLVDTFTKYCQNLNNNMGCAVQYMIDMDKKYPGLFKLQEQILRQRFTTNTQDDYTVVPGSQSLPRILQTQPFISMAHVVVKKNLLPNFFKKETLDYVHKADPQYVTVHGPLSPFVLLHGLLVWSTFDEAEYLRQKKRSHQAPAKEEARIIGKHQMSKIAADRALGKRFIESIFR